MFAVRGRDAHVHAHMNERFGSFFFFFFFASNPKNEDVLTKWDPSCTKMYEERMVVRILFTNNPVEGMIADAGLKYCQLYA